MRVHLFPARPRLLAVVITIAMLLLMLVPVAASAKTNTANGFYQQTNLVSNRTDVGAKFQDPNLLNPWGLSHGPTTPWWVSDNGAGVATLYNGQGQAFPLASPLVVTIPPPASSPGTTAAPTGNVFNGTSGFVVSTASGSGPRRQRQLAMFSTARAVLSCQRPGVRVQAFSSLRLKTARSPAGTPLLTCIMPSSK